MCVVFYRKDPAPGVLLAIIFNRDEYLDRKRMPLAVTEAGVICGVDLEAQGTWLGVNV